MWPEFRNWSPDPLTPPFLCRPGTNCSSSSDPLPPPTLCPRSPIPEFRLQDVSPIQEVGKQPGTNSVLLHIAISCVGLHTRVSCCAACFICLLGGRKGVPAKFREHREAKERGRRRRPSGAQRAEERGRRRKVPGVQRGRGKKEKTTTNYSAERRRRKGGDDDEGREETTTNCPEKLCIAQFLLCSESTEGRRKEGEDDYELEHRGAEERGRRRRRNGPGREREETTRNNRFGAHTGGCGN